MQYVKLGNTGLKVSRLCLGMMTYGTPEWRDWVLNEEQSRPFIRRAREAGVNFFDLSRVQKLAMDHGRTPAQIALAWMLHKPGITAPIIGASKMHQLEEAIAALEIQLSREELVFLEEPYVPHPVLGHG
jgi:aryl-alcohol dehydrogenase-like predicted oxidoreductase